MSFIRALLFFAILATVVHGDAYTDFCKLLISLGVKNFSPANIQSIGNCTNPTIYAQQNSTMAAKKVQDCTLSFCLNPSNYGSCCSPAIQAMTANDQCLKPGNTNTSAVIAKVVSKIGPFIKDLYGNITAIIGQGKTKGLSQYNTLLGGYDYGNKTINRAVVDTICKGLMPYLTPLEKNCTKKNLPTVFNLAGYQFATML